MTKTKQFKPMLAATLDTEDLSTVRYPVLASPKLDGIRCVIRDGRALSRSLKPIPNKYIREHLESLADVLEGCDGELMIDDVPFQEITSFVMSPDKSPGGKNPIEWYFAVFDHHSGNEFSVRLDSAGHAVAGAESKHVLHVEHRTVNSERELLDFEEDMLREGFEGLMLRDPEGLYKYGRSTVREGGLLKLKRFSDDEAVIVGAVELQHNDNEAFTGELGQTKRSTAKAGKVAGGTLGALVVEHPKFGRFELGTGFTAEQRDELWGLFCAGELRGQRAKFKYFAIGVKDKPRHPVFLSIRSREDMS